MSVAKFTKVESLFRTTLAAGITSTQQTIVLNDAPGNLTEFPQWFVIEPLSSNYEIIYVPADDASATLTNVVRGINPNEDTDVLSASFCKAHAANVDVILAPMHRHWNELVDVMDGTDGTGAAIFRVGTGVDVNITIFAENADANKPFFRYDAVTNKWLISNDGVSTYDITSGGSGLLRGPGVDIVASAITLDVRASGGLRNNQGTGSVQADVDPTIVARLDTVNTFTAVQSFTSARAQITTEPGAANDAVRAASAGFVTALVTGAGIDGSSTPQCVAILTSDGLVYKADANDNTLVKALGFINSNALITTSPVIRTSGILAGFTGLTKNLLYYLSDTAGGISATPSTTCSAPVGFAVSTTELLIIIGKKIAYGTVAHGSAGAGTQDVVTTIGFLASAIHFGITMTVQSTAGGTISKANGVLSYRGTVLGPAIMGVQDGSVTAVTSSIFDDYMVIAPPTLAAANAGANGTGLFSLNAVSNTGFTTRIVNTTTLGAGVNSAATLTYIAYE